MELRTRDELFWSSIFSKKKKKKTSGATVKYCDLVLDECASSKGKTKKHSKLGKNEKFRLNIVSPHLYAFHFLMGKCCKISHVSFQTVSFIRHVGCNY